MNIVKSSEIISRECCAPRLVPFLVFLLLRETGVHRGYRVWEVGVYSHHVQVLHVVYATPYCHAHQLLHL